MIQTTYKFYKKMTKGVSSMDRRTLVTATVILFILTLTGIFLLQKMGKIRNTVGYPFETISPDVLYLTNPVHSFGGTVEKVGTNTISVSRTIVLDETELPPAPDSDKPAPAPRTKKLSYNVIVTAKTDISRSFSVPVKSSQKLSAKDIKVGEKVSVESDKDLRTLFGNSFEATTIILPNSNNILTGIITAVEKDKILVSSTLPQTAGGEYTVSLTSDTDIALPEKLASLISGMNVVVITDVDAATTQKVTAVRIEEQQEQKSTHEPPPPPPDEPETP